MKQAAITKEAGDSLSPEQLQAISRYCRRTLEPEKLYVFSLVLCDNEVDRDWERFTAAALHKLAALFEGKTGIFDHDAKGRSQTARIFQTRVEPQPGRVTAAGEEYACLRAWAYMVRCDSTRDLILEIDGGIKKEVSVGCRVERMTCSVCGADARGEGCAHIPGRSYPGPSGEMLCHRVLEEPSDAYEWSFVAVPAQTAAGVTKGARLTPELLRKELGRREITLSLSQGRALADRLDELERQAALGRDYREELRREVLRLGSLAHPGLDGAVLAKAAAALNCGELKSLAKSFAAQAGLEQPPQPQLYRPPSPSQNTPFKL